MGAIGAVIGNISQRIGARERARAMYQQADELDINAEIEEVNAKVTANDLRANLMKTLASNNVALAASNLAGGGSVEAQVSADTDDFGRQLRNVELDSKLKAGALRREARSTRRQAKYGAITGNLNASASTLQSFGSFGGGG